MGFDFQSSNKGCEALAYSFLNMLLECIGENLEIYNYSYGGLGSFPERFPSVTFHIRRPRIKDIREWFKIKKEFDSYDIIFDVTFGDGFSDIYGKVWNATTNVLKTLAVKSRTPFVLLPQTYGPYNNQLLKLWAKYIVNHANYVYSRDVESADYMKRLCKKNIVTLTDIAFSLPYDKNEYASEFDRTICHVGINISSLLWDSDYAKKNKFGLKVDYNRYIKELINKTLENPNVKVHLISHVVENNNYNNPENDLRCCNDVKELFPTDRVIVGPGFKNPMEAKSYIANLDFFIGARMHATIAAVSSGVATVPFAYSKKFKTMFGNLDYPYVIEARCISTEQALEQTLSWMNDKKKITAIAQESSRNTREQLDVLRKNIVEMVGRNE